MNGHRRHAGTADYARDGDEAGKRVKVQRPPTPQPPPPPPEALEDAAPQTPPPASPAYQDELPPGIEASPTVPVANGGTWGAAATSAAEPQQPASPEQSSGMALEAFKY